MINLKNINKSYPNVQLFKDFNLDIETGKITCILGESGSGKTTLLNILANLTDYSGEVQVEKSSYVFQTPNLFPNLTVNNNLKIICENQSAIDEILKDFDIFEKKGSYPNSLSGGQASRVSLARGLLYDAPILLLDEPFNSLDLALKYKILNIVKKHHQDKKNTVVIVTHDIKEAVFLADRVIILKNGYIVGDYCEINKKTENDIFSLLINGNI